jgi:pimeloyl-ACP methyl ester carboxylesterase
MSLINKNMLHGHGLTLRISPNLVHNKRANGHNTKLHTRAAASSMASPASAASKNTVSLDSMICRDQGPPRLTCPLPDFEAEMPLAGRSSLPMMLYLPGIDGTGLAAQRQFETILARFDLITLVTPPEDRTDFSTLVDIVVKFLKEEVPLHSPTRPIYILGESFGGVLALAVGAAAPHLVDRLILVNPATSFEDSLWPLIGPLLPNVPSQAYQALPIALAPLLGNPVNLLSAALDSTDETSSLGDRLNAVVRGAAQLLSQLPLLADLLPPETLAWKLKLLQEGCVEVAPLLGQVPQRVLLIVGDQDLLIPSKEEGPRLQRALPRAHLRVEKGRSHALLQEGGVDLVSIMDQEGALVWRRRMSAPTKKRDQGKNAGFGSAAPIELPTEVELKRYADRTTGIGRRLASPIFFSTADNGEISQGLGNIPTPGNGPVLYVGNHQTLALDLGVLCEEFLSKREIMLRGLAHPVIFAQATGESSNSSSSSSSNNNTNNGSSNSSSGSGGLSPFDVIPAFGQLFSGRGIGGFLPGGGNGNAEPSSNGNSGNGGGKSRPTDGRQAFADFMVEFGAVPVSGRNLIRLLQNGENVLLFPGGVREAYRRKNEEYQLFWPQRAEFVRMAAKYGATIVPFAAVGVDDSLEIILDGDELKKTPIIGQMVTSRAAGLPQARRGVSAGGTRGGEEEESFISPLALPKLPPRRMYFLFQKPITTSVEDLDDRVRVEQLYNEVKGQVQGGLDYLLSRRKEDPYEDFGKRVVYEATRMGKQAPTFPLP